MDPGKFLGELKRRNVYKVAVAYIVGGWALAQGIAQVLPVFDVPNWVIRLLVILIIIGFPIALAFSWAFELTPEGLKRTEDVDPTTPHTIRGAWIYIVLVRASRSRFRSFSLVAVTPAKSRRFRFVKIHVNPSPCCRVHHSE